MTKESSDLGIRPTNFVLGEVPPQFLEVAIGSEVRIDNTAAGVIRGPTAYSSISEQYLAARTRPTVVPSGRYTWMGERWVYPIIDKKNVAPIRAGVLKKVYPHSRKHPRYYFIILENNN